MSIEEFKNFFLEEAKKINVSVNDDMLNKFYNYMKEIIVWNEKVNVTAITEEKMFIVKHFIDSLTVNRFVEDIDAYMG